MDSAGGAEAPKAPPLNPPLVSLTKKALTFFFSPQLILQKSNGQFQRNLSFFKVPEGVQLFPGGVGGVGGVQLLIPYRYSYNL